MNYTETIEYLYSLRFFGLKLGLENTRKLAALAGNPQEQLRFIHIAGTNGKGSVAAMLESIYHASGLKVGLYTSPHLVSFRERIQVNRQCITEADVMRLVHELQAQSRTGFHAASNIKDGQEVCPTFFEFVTVLALRYFAQQQCDLVIWETGMGGRLDATNIVTPLASVITNIELDHQRWLGHDLASVAQEKAGIIKPNVPTITATSEPQPLTVIQKTAREKNSTLTQVTPDQTEHSPLDAINLPLLGDHQRLNAAVAISTVQVLHETLPVSDKDIRSGLESVSWPGRLQLLERSSGQRILLDGAHNASSAQSLRTVLETLTPKQKPGLILGVLNDKSLDCICEILAPLADRIVGVQIKSERCADPELVAAACRKASPSAQVCVAASIADALEQLMNEPMVVVAGSLYLVGEALVLLEGKDSSDTDERKLNDWIDKMPRPTGHSNSR